MCKCSNCSRCRGDAQPKPLSKDKGKVQKKKENKLTSDSFMYVCVAGNGEMLVFFLFPPNNSKFSMYAWGKKRKMLVFTGVYVCVKAKLTLVSFFFLVFFAPYPYHIT